MALRDDIGQLSGDHPTQEIAIVESGPFLYNNEICFLEDDGEGVMRIMTGVEQNHREVEKIGTVNYGTGEIKLEGFQPDAILNANELAIIARTAEVDITSARNTILSIRDADIRVRVEQVRI
jgi:hypothetical protein